MTFFSSLSFNHIMHKFRKIHNFVKSIQHTEKRIFPCTEKIFLIFIFFSGFGRFFVFPIFSFRIFLSKQKHLSRRYLRMLIGKCCAKHKHESHIRNLSHFHFHITYFVMLKILIFFVDFKTLDIIFLLYDLLLYFVTTSFTFTIDFSIFLNLLCLFSLLIFFIFSALFYYYFFTFLF